MYADANDFSKNCTKVQKKVFQKNQVITYSTIENYVWEGSFVSLESIRSLIRRVRKILNKEYIQTVVDTGYIFKNI